MRNFIEFNQYEAAHHLVSKTFFPENKFNNKFVRFLYYTGFFIIYRVLYIIVIKGKIKAVKLEYAESYSRLMQAIRKTPDNVGLGFKIHVKN